VYGPPHGYVAPASPPLAAYSHSASLGNLNLFTKSSPFDFLYEVGIHWLKNNFEMRNYQIEDVYTRIFPFLTEKELFNIKR